LNGFFEFFEFVELIDTKPNKPNPPNKPDQPFVKTLTPLSGFLDKAPRPVSTTRK